MTIFKPIKQVSLALQDNMKANSKLNILFLTDGITPYVVGGMQKNSTLFSKLFASRGHKVTLVHCGFIGTQSFNEDYSKVFSIAELELITPVFIPFLKSDQFPGHYVRENKIYSKKIKNFIGDKLIDYDLIYSKGFVSYSFLNNKENIPVLVNIHGYEMFQKAPSLKVKLAHYFLRPITKHIIKNADYVLSYGGKIDQILLDLDIPKEKIIKHTNGIDQEWITKKPLHLNETITFTFIGRNERRKGIEELTIALKKLILKNSIFKFNFITSIPLTQQISHPNINYIDVSGAENIKKYLDQSDVLICPSHAEGMPTVILEAMARGNAIIATDVGATSKLINKNGWLVDSTPASILEHLIKAINLTDKEILELKSNSIKHLKDNFIYENFIDLQIKEIMEKCFPNSNH